MFFATYCLHLIKIGSAVWWFNTKSDSVPDPVTKHAACPVLLGQKWRKFNVCDFFFSNYLIIYYNLDFFSQLETNGLPILLNSEIDLVIYNQTLDIKG